MTMMWSENFSKYPPIQLPPNPSDPRWSLKKNSLMVTSAHGILGWAVSSHKQREEKARIFK